MCITMRAFVSLQTLLLVLSTLDLCQANKYKLFLPQTNLTDDGSTEMMRSDCLADMFSKHNIYRRRHGVPPLQYSDHLTAYAKWRAKDMASTGNFNHLPNGPYGENLWMGTSNRWTCDQAIKTWYDEIKHYNFGRPSITESTGHFTQVVWLGSRFLGCAMAYGRKLDQTHINCQYDPPGNLIGDEPNNVPKLVA